MWLACEILLPLLLFFGILYTYRKQDTPIQLEDETESEFIRDERIIDSLSTGTGPPCYTTIGTVFGPKVPNANDLLKTLNNYVPGRFNFVPYANVEVVVNELIKEADLRTRTQEEPGKCKPEVLIYVDIFDLENAQLNYTIYMDAQRSVPSQYLERQFIDEDPYSKTAGNGHYREYIKWQTLLINIFMDALPKKNGHEHLLNGSEAVNTNETRPKDNYLFDPIVRPFPKPPLNKVDSREIVVIMLLSNAHLLLLPVLLRTVSIIAAEQESGHRDLLKVMGMGGGVFITSHLLFLWFKILLTLCPMMFYTGKYLSSIVSIPLVMLLSFVYSINCLFFVGICAILSPTGKTSFNVTLIVYLLCYVLHDLSKNRGMVAQGFYALNFNCAFPTAIAIAFDHYHRKKQLGFGSMFENMKWERSIGLQLVMLIVDAVWMYGLMMGLDRIRQEFNFDNLCFWRKTDTDHESALKIDDLAENHEKDETREQAPADIKMENVVKVYKNGHIGVRRLDLTAHRNQVTALLGHNGAGKTTAFNMISGSMFPTSGSVYVNDEEPIGYCPQHNVIYDDLTVGEHLWLFTRLKGVKGDIEEELVKMLADLNFEDKRNVRAKRLSGGQKRKLCLGMTLIGNPRVVLLDEPTAGMDVAVRDSVITLLEKYKENRTILITTHYLDEAEEMGDWIYIMFDGVVFTSGSVDYLIQKYGSGTILKFQAAQGRNVDEVSKELSLAAKEALGIETKGNVFEGQVEIAVPNDPDFSGWHERFVKFLRTIESNKEKLGYDTFGIERNSLESVFFRVGELAEELTGRKKDDVSYEPVVDEYHPRIKRPLFRFLALMMKRLLYTMNNMFSFIFYIVFPIAGLFIALKLVRLLDQHSVAGVRLMTLDNLHGMLFVRTNGDSPQLTANDIDAYFKDVGHDSELVKLEAGSEYNKFVANYVDMPPLGIGIIFENGTVYGVYSLYGTHTKPTVLNLMANIQLRKYLSSTSSGKPPTITEYLQTYVVPRPPSDEPTKIGPTFYPICLILPAILCISFIVEERKSRFDHLQQLTPLTKVHFWLANYVYDYVSYMSAVLGFLIILQDPFTGKFQIIVLVSVLFFLFTATFIYTLSVMFKTPVTAEIVILIMLIASFLIATMFKYFSDQNKRPILQKEKEEEDRTEIFTSENFAYFISPLYCVFKSLFDPKYNYEESGYDGRSIVFLSVDTVLCFICFVLVRFFAFCFSCQLRIVPELVEATQPTETIVCEDVKAEEQRVVTSTPADETRTRSRDTEQGTVEDYVLKVVKLSKSFPSKKALRDVTFGIKRGECFGLLGASGAGKTTAFDIITGLASASKGSVYSERDYETGVKIGYCPQFDAIFGYLTGKQALVILACLHGYAHPFKKADHVLDLVDMYSMRNKKMKNCSGGQKRRISMAAALLARAPLTIFDEPTAGVDVKCRRDLWKHLNKTRTTENATMMLSSHSMEECEALCTRIAILNHGEMVAIGSAQYLKSKYGGSFKIIIVLKHFEKRQAAIDEMKKEFATAELLTTSEKSVHMAWKVDKTDTDDWSTVWHRGSQIALNLEAKSFSVTQASLEEAFLQVIANTKT